MILTSNRLDLNSVEINKIDESIYYRIMKINKHNKFYNDVRDIIAEGFIKYRDITLSKCFI